MTETDQEYAHRVNSLSEDEVEALIARDACPYEPERIVEVPMGMFHCPLCGEMVLAGVPHLRQKDLP